MSESQPAAAPSRPREVLAWCLANRQYLVAAVLMSVTALGWTVAVERLKIYTRKRPVPWPDGVKVGEDFRLLSLADRFGPYVLAGDGELERNKDGSPKRDGKPDGEIVFEEHLLDTLKIGTSTDKDNLPDRQSNWYVSRIYRDTAVAPRDPRGYWQLDVQYYTGGVDVVPHIPEICLVAGGATILRTDDVQCSVPAAPSPWDGPIVLRRAIFSRSSPNGSRSSQFAQYYTFSLNGEPESRREMVRGKLLNPFVRHAYFAKIQVAPRWAILDSQQADEQARRFLRFCLPQVLKVLPMADDVKKLGEQAEGTGG